MQRLFDDCNECAKFVRAVGQLEWGSTTGLGRANGEAITAASDDIDGRGPSRKHPIMTAPSRRHAH